MNKWYFFLIAAVPSLLLAHPVPDIPVKTSIAGAIATVTIEIDPRSFTEDPTNEPYMFESELRLGSDEKKQMLREKGQDLVDRTIRFVFTPEKSATPTLEFTFAGINGVPLVETDDPVMLIGTAQIEIPATATGYQVIADESGELSVIFKNEIEGKGVERFNVLFPGEESYVLDISNRKK